MEIFIILVGIGLKTVWNPIHSTPSFTVNLLIPWWLWPCPVSHCSHKNRQHTWPNGYKHSRPNLEDKIDSWHQRSWYCLLWTECHEHKSQTAERKVWLFNKADWLGMAQHLEHTSNISNKAYFPSLNHLWAHIKDAIHDAMVAYIPRKLSKWKDFCPWIDRDLRKLVKTHDRLYKRCKKWGGLLLEQWYLRYRSIVKQKPEESMLLVFISCLQIKTKAVLRGQNNFGPISNLDA